MAYIASRKRLRANSPAATRKVERSLAPWWRNLDWEKIRFRIVGVVFILVWTGLWVRAGHVQLWEGPYLAERARRQQMSAETVATPRGIITDRNGVVLARSVECKSVYVNPSLVEDIQNTATRLAVILDMPMEPLRAQLEKKRSFVWVTRRIDDATAETVRKASLPGVELAREYERMYPFKQVAGQLLGFVGMDGKGLEGLELAFDGELSGLSTRQVVQRDAAGRRFNVDTDDVAATPQSLRLSIDLQVQFIAEEVLAGAIDTVGAKWGGALIADVESGDVLAWAQYPFFNPNAFREYSSGIYRNRLALDALEPGSTFKPFLLLSALQEGTITRDTVFDCEGGVWKSKLITIRDDTRGYKELPVHRIFSLSSNIGCAKIGLTLGAVKYHRYLSQLGFGQRTGLHVAESRGILRNPRDWSEADVISASFGQSVSVTAAQMAQGYMIIANNGMYKPLRLILNEDTEVQGGEQRIFSEKAAKEVVSMMREVVDSGTGKRAAIPGVAVAGKTGTAQKARGGRYTQERMASFVGLVPAEKPKYLVVIMVDEPTKVSKYGGVIAAPLFREVTERVLAYYGALPDAGAVEGNKKAPRLTRAQQKALAQAEARAEVRRKAIESEMVTGEFRQEMAGGISRGVDSHAVPDVVGKSVRRAVEMFAQQGLVPEIKGEGAHVVRQKPAAGVPWKKLNPGDNTAEECVLWLSEK